MHDCTIFGRKIGDAGLSDGQKVLLQLCVLLHAQSVSLKDVVLVLDEPENHLHPAAQAEFIAKIKEVLKNGQIWIATHSIHILSQINTSDIWYMADGSICYAGKIPEVVLNGLLGNDEQIQKLRDFIDLPQNYAVNSFAYECLFAPMASNTGKDDPQTNQIRKILDQKRKTSETVKVLDYGAGKGRLLSAIYENEEDKGNIHSWLDYKAFDAYPSDSEECKNVISRVYGDTENRYFSSVHELMDKVSNNHFDCVVLCNVLHEVSPIEWPTLLSGQSVIATKMAANGFLVIIEDLQLPTGENPNSDGFFILGEAEVKMLFHITNKDECFETADYNGKHRLMAYYVPKDCLSRVTSETRKQALLALKEKSMSQISSLRSSSEYDFRSGRTLALWTQQLANTILIIPKL